MVSHNPGINFDEKLINNVNLNLTAIKKRASEYATRRTVKKEHQVAWLLRAITCIDLTTLSGDDTESNVQKLCYKASNPIRADLLKELGFQPKELTCGAVCVYPSRVSDAFGALSSFKMNEKIPVAAVATGFPSGQYHLETRLREIKLTVADGASEIDIVINRTAALQGNWKLLYDELKQMKEACGNAHMKSILAVGELGTLENVYKASMVAMMAGTDFIKTSTGKEGVNATLVNALVMIRALRDFYWITGYKVGFKPAGGIRTAKDACVWLTMMKEELDEEWTTNKLFRLGASALLGDIERQVYHYVTGRYAAAYELP
ncbi:deoxyribose-phosphate aldolase [Brachionus plicatilis]|uniref:Deoxyribose-phosphate aldolase n=1 Tax=Brachionus plicatilis TaxID=10195 RepID=A0A3M7PIQ2_BRAPC|nr:deoxyribose-phosphate aldolase [Brachionus plicatilis]